MQTHEIWIFDDVRLSKIVFAQIFHFRLCARWLQPLQVLDVHVIHTKNIVESLEIFIGNLKISRMFSSYVR